MKIDIQGKVVEVDDSFASMSPDQQSATIDDIAKQMNIHAEVKQEVDAVKNAEPGFAERNPGLATAAGIVAGPLAAAANLVTQHPLETAGMGFGAYKANKMADAYLNRSQIAAEAQHAQAAAQQAQAQADLLAEQGRANRFNVRQGMPSAPAEAPMPRGPVAPQSAVPQTRMPMPTNMPAGPVAPQGMAQAAQAAPESWMSRAVQMGDQAMQKASPALRGAGQTAMRGLGTVADLAARYNPALVGAQLATYSPTLGPRVPQSGPYRGMEINPRTGRPWSPEELNAIASGRY